MTEFPKTPYRNPESQLSLLASHAGDQIRNLRIVCDTALRRISLRNALGKKSREVTVAVAIGPNMNASFGAALGWSRRTRVTAVRKALYAAIATAMKFGDGPFSVCLVADEALEPEITDVTRSIKGLTITATFSLQTDAPAKAAIERALRPVLSTSELHTSAVRTMARQGGIQRILEADPRSEFTGGDKGA